MRTLILGTLVLIVAGCAPLSQETMQALATSDRSWCVSVTTIYGTLKMAGSGLDAGSLACNAEGMLLNATQQGMGSGDVLVVPRVLRRDPATWTEVPITTGGGGLRVAP